MEFPFDAVAFTGGGLEATYSQVGALLRLAAACRTSVAALLQGLFLSGVSGGGWTVGLVTLNSGLTNLFMTRLTDASYASIIRPAFDRYIEQAKAIFDGPNSEMETLTRYASSDLFQVLNSAVLGTLTPTPRVNAPCGVLGSCLLPSDALTVRIIATDVACVLPIFCDLLPPYTVFAPQVSISSKGSPLILPQTIASTANTARLLLTASANFPAILASSLVYFDESPEAQRLRALACRRFCVGGICADQLTLTTSHTTPDVLLGDGGWYDVTGITGALRGWQGRNPGSPGRLRLLSFLLCSRDSAPQPQSLGVRYLPALAPLFGLGWADPRVPLPADLVPEQETLLSLASLQLLAVGGLRISTSNVPQTSPMCLQTTDATMYTEQLTEGAWVLTYTALESTLNLAAGIRAGTVVDLTVVALLTETTDPTFFPLNHSYWDRYAPVLQRCFKTAPTLTAPKPWWVSLGRHLASACPCAS